MAKFKVSRNILKELTGDAFYRIVHIYAVLPDYIELEGELLEGGTVEKCCSKCSSDPFGVKYSSAEHCEDFRCSCHNKKEEKCICGFAKSKHLDKTDFNRETPKRCPTCGHTKEMGTVSRCDSAFHREEVKLPEMLKSIISWSHPYDMTLTDKINEILTYLASKENEKNH